MKFDLRPWRMADLDDLVKYADNWKIARNLTDAFPHPYTRASGERFINMASSGEPVSIFAIDIDGEAVGAVGLHQQADVYQRNMELGYWLGEPFWGQGIITEAIGRIISYGFEHFDIDRIFARPYGSNIASQRVLEKTGFKLEAKMEKTFWKKDRYEDELIYAVRR